MLPRGSYSRKSASRHYRDSEQEGENHAGSSTRREFLQTNCQTQRIVDTAGKNSARYHSSIAKQRRPNLRQENNLNRTKTEFQSEDDFSSSFEKMVNDQLGREENLNKDEKPNENIFNLEEIGHESNILDDVKMVKDSKSKGKGREVSPNKVKNWKDLSVRNKSKIFPSSINSTKPDQKSNPKKTPVHNNKSSEKNSEQVLEIKFDGTSEFVELPYSKRRVPMIFKRMVHVKHLPVDPMLKYNKQKYQFSLGFKITEIADSQKTNSDNELDKQHRLWCQIEALTGVFGMKFPKLIIENTLFPIVTREDLKRMKEEAYEWCGDGEIVHDPNERLWNWERSMVNSNRLLGKDGKPTFNPDLDIRYMSHSPDFEPDSFGPVEYDEQLRKLFIDSSSQVSDTSDDSSISALDYDEENFLHSNFCHPLNNNRFNQYRLKRLLNKEGTLLNANRISQTDSQLLDLMYRDILSKKPKCKNGPKKLKKSSSSDKNESDSDSKTSSLSNSSLSMVEDAMNSAVEINPSNSYFTVEPYTKNVKSQKKSRVFRRSSSTIEREEEKWRYYWRKSLRGGSSVEESRRIYREILQELEDELEEVEEGEEFHSSDQPIHRSSSIDALSEAKRVRKKTKDIRTRFVKSWMNEVDQIVYHLQKDIYDDSFRRKVDKSIQTRAPTPYWVRVGKPRKSPPEESQIDIGTNSDESAELVSQTEKTAGELTKLSSELSNQEDESCLNEVEGSISSSAQQVEGEEKDENSQEESEESRLSESHKLEDEDWSLQVYIEGKTAAQSHLKDRTVEEQGNLPHQETDSILQDQGIDFALDLSELSEEEDMEEMVSEDSQLSEEDDYESSNYEFDQINPTDKSLSLSTEDTKISFLWTSTRLIPAKFSRTEDMPSIEKARPEPTDSIPFRISKEEENVRDKTDTITRNVSGRSKKRKMPKSLQESSELLSTQYPFTSVRTLTSMEKILKDADEESPDKPRAKFHFAPNVVIESAKSRPKRRNRYRKPMRLLQIKIAEGEEHKRSKPKVDKGVQTLKYIPIWKRSPPNLPKALEYEPPLKEARKITRPTELTSMMINEDDRLIESIFGLPPISKIEKANDLGKQQKKEAIEVHDGKFRKRLEERDKNARDDSNLPLKAGNDPVDSKQAEKTETIDRTELGKIVLDRLNKKYPSATLNWRKYRSPATPRLNKPSESPSPLRQPKMYQEMVSFFENMTRWEKILFDFSYKGWEHAGYDWDKIKEVVFDPDGQYWADMYDNIREDEYFAQYEKQHVIKDFMPKAGDRGKFGLGRRCASLVNGTVSLYSGLFRADPKMTSIEMVLDAMYKDRLFGLPLSLQDADEMRHYYTNIIVKDPKLYRSIMKNRDCLQHDLLVMVHNVLKGLNITDNALADRYPCRQQTRMIQLEANKKYASIISPEEGRKRGDKSRLNSFIKIGEKRPHEIYFEKHFNDATSDFRYPPAEQLIIDAAMAVDMDKEARIKVYNPAMNIIEDARFLKKDFALYAYPLFETNWRDIGYDRDYEIILPELRELRDLRQLRLDKMKAHKTFTREENDDYAQKSRMLCKDLVDRVCRMLKSSKERGQHNGVWKCLLACIHGITFWREIEDRLVDNFKEWMPMLLVGLLIDNKLVRQEVCFVIALLVSNYRFISKLHKESKNRLISNLTFALLDAIEEHPESYVFYHGVLAYLLHSVPCNATLLAILTWVPEIMDRGDEGALAKDWPLFIYYVAKHWPQSAIRWRYNHEEKILELLERALLRPISKRNAQLALKYVRRIDLQLQRESSGTDVYKIIGGLNPCLFEQLIELRLSGKCGEDSLFLNFFVQRNSELRFLTLARVHPQALDKILQGTPKLRSLTLEDPSLEIAAISKSILNAKLTNLEVLVSPESKMDEVDDDVVEKCFASLNRLRVLNLSGSSGKHGERILMSILNGLGSVEEHVYGQLELTVTYFGLKEKPNTVDYLTSLAITIKETGDKNGTLKKFLSSFPNLESLTVGGEPKSTGKTLSQLADALTSKECSVSNLILRRICNENDLSEFLGKLVEKDKKLKFLDIRAFLLSDDQTKYLPELIKAADPNEPFSLFFKYFSLRKHAGYTGQVDAMVRRKWPSLKVCLPYQLYVAKNGRAIVHMEFTKVQLEDSEKSVRSEVPSSRRLLELEKFEGSVLNPSKEFSELSSKLTNMAMKTHRKMPKSNLEQLELLYPKVLQAKISLEEYRRLSSLQTNLLETVLDPEQCDQSFSKVLDDIKSAIESSVESMYTVCSQQMKEVTYNESPRTFTPLLSFQFNSNVETQKIIANFVHQELGDSLRTMIMDLRVKVAEKMLTFMMESLEKEFANCLEGFPSKTALEPLQPAREDGEYVTAHIFKPTSATSPSLALPLNQSLEGISHYRPSSIMSVSWQYLASNFVEKPRPETIVDERLGRPALRQRRPQRTQTTEKENLNKPVDSPYLTGKPAALQQVEITYEALKSQLAKPNDAPAPKTMFQIMPNEVTAEISKIKELKKVDYSSTPNANISKNSEPVEQVRMRIKEKDKPPSLVEELRSQFEQSEKKGNDLNH
ncbi:unnamed protein product [Rodentolepis nana]|uniref:C2 domain-containing protein n=1 Tax=Rodentolepis nana TaxID=102285 RepID=A0A158QIL6_RODNA|nr:unnamed protein product [Rodentolepis nana]